MDQTTSQLPTQPAGQPKSNSPKFIMIAVALLAVVGIPLTIIQSQNQQNILQRANTVQWATSQGALTICAEDGSGVDIKVRFNNTEPVNKPSLYMDVVAKDQQTGQTVNMGTIKGGESKLETIRTGKDSLSAGKVTFLLTWSDGHSGTDSRTATYQSVSKCLAPTPTNTPPPNEPTPTPTICPTLGPVKNVHIDCPNCL